MNNQTEQPLLAWTIDDLPDGESTDRYLSLMRRFGIVATCFLVGDNIAKYPEQPNALVQMGCELGNHSYTHRNLTECSESEARQELKRNADAISAYVPREKIRLIRPPYYAYDAQLCSMVDAPLILSSCNEGENKEQSLERLGQAKDGDIILTHGWNTSTVAALEERIPMWLAAGYRFVTVSQLFALRGIEPKAGGIYYALPPTGVIMEDKI